MRLPRGISAVGLLPLFNGYRDCSSDCLLLELSVLLDARECPGMRDFFAGPALVEELVLLAFVGALPGCR
jgi:hypothetical protein